mmetsp:Transcript_23197/g.25569  ORF Transcript_23197/g.25569 Transcript_23197/m.25569 type:complete len:372 (-) Transcript_23197:333-1448(-)
MMASSSLESMRFTKSPQPKLEVLDQLLIPQSKVYIDIPDVETAWSVIRCMQIRGAPLIALVACLGLAVDINVNVKTKNEIANLCGDDLKMFIQKKMDYLATSRPTAVNLFNALQEIKIILEEQTDATHASYSKAILDHAEFMLERDISDNKNIGNNGADAILQKVKGKRETIRMVTICNTGSLATAGYGTALGVARALQERSALASIHALETRPYNQGSRLTAFEILEEKMPNGTLICDSAAGALMKTKGVDVVVVGADRVCANGDTANKIGTYNLAIVASVHHVPVYVASPFTTLDTSLLSGDLITIEERPAAEMISTGKAPSDMPCWNPAFDITPAKYIAGIITEKGVIEPQSDGTFDVPAFVKKYTAT